jgi:predicted transcriptional regulator
MVRPKAEVQRILESVPDDASFEEIQYRIYVCQRIKRGLRDIDSGRVLTQKDVERRMTRWLAR